MRVVFNPFIFMADIGLARIHHKGGLALPLFRTGRQLTIGIHLHISRRFYNRIGDALTRIIAARHQRNKRYRTKNGKYAFTNFTRICTLFDARYNRHRHLPFRFYLGS